MKKKNKQNFILSLLVVCIVVGGLYIIYAYVIAPKLERQSQLVAENTTLATEEMVLKQQLQQEKEYAEKVAVSDTELHMKVPMKRDIATFIKQIEQFEGISQVLVSGVAFNNYDTVVSQQFSEQQNAEEIEQTNIVEQAEKTVDEKSDGDNTEEVTKPSTSIDYASLPDDIKLMTVSMTISAMEESEIMEFLKQVEKSMRLIRVDSIDYTAENPEQEEVLKSEKLTIEKKYPVIATVQLTTFYEQGLATSE